MGAGRCVWLFWEIIYCSGAEAFTKCVLRVATRYLIFVIGFISSAGYVYQNCNIWAAVVLTGLGSHSNVVM